MTSVIILGAGGHAKVVADILLCQGRSITGFLDDDPKLWGNKLLDIPVLGSIDLYSTYGMNEFIIGIGSNAVRKALVEKIEMPLVWCNAVHPRAILAASVRIGVGLVAAASAIINPDSVIGDHVIINTAASVDHDCEIGSFCHIAPGAHLGGGVQVGEGTLIGIGATVHPYRKIGRNVVVGAGAVVVDNLPDNVTVVGIPARPVKKE